MRVAAVRFVRRAAIVVVAIVGWLFVVGTGTSIAQAGTWGSGNWPYLNGVVCTEPGETIPLVSWPLTSVAGPAYLSAGIVDNDGIDSGRPPTGPPAAPDPPITSATGMYTPAQIAAIAYLIATWGADPSPERVAEVAEIVTEQGGAPTGEPCLATGQGATSGAEAQQMWTQAQQDAGPYQVNLSANASTLVYRPAGRADRDCDVCARLYRSRLAGHIQQHRVRRVATAADGRIRAGDGDLDRPGRSTGHECGFAEFLGHGERSGRAAGAKRARLDIGDLYRHRRQRRRFIVAAAVAADEAGHQRDDAGSDRAGRVSGGHHDFGQRAERIRGGCDRRRRRASPGRSVRRVSHN